MAHITREQAIDRYLKVLKGSLYPKGPIQRGIVDLILSVDIEARRESFDTTWRLANQKIETEAGIAHGIELNVDPDESIEDVIARLVQAARKQGAENQDV